jgi:hypothetical protein
MCIICYPCHVYIEARIKCSPSAFVTAFLTSLLNTGTFLLDITFEHRIGPFRVIPGNAAQRTPLCQSALSRGPLVLVELTLGFPVTLFNKGAENFPSGLQTRVKPNKRVEILQIKMKTEFVVPSCTLSSVR